MIAVVEVTNKCMLNCTGCYNIGEEETMELKKFKKVIKKLPADTKIYISGGEPLILGDDLVKYCTHAGDPVIYTSGFVNDEELLEKLKSVISLFKVNYNFPMEPYASIWKGKKGALEHTEKFLKVCDQKGIPTELLWTINKLNVLLFPAVIDICNEYNSKLVALPFLDYDGSNEDLMLSFDHCRKFLRFFKGYGADTVFLDMCPAGVRRIAIGTDGQVRPCVYLSYKAGNIFEEEFPTIKKRLESWREEKGNVGCIALRKYGTKSGGRK